MKLKTTAKEVKNKYPTVVSVGYCGLGAMLNYTDPQAYTCGVYGWNADVYDLGLGIALSTGYRPFGKAVPHDIVKTYEDEAERILNEKLSYREQKAALDDLKNGFAHQILREVA